MKMMRLVSIAVLILAFVAACGVLRDQESFVQAYVRQLDTAGFTAHIHVIGDRAARVAVDVLENVMDPVAGNPLRHTLAHLQVIHPDEVERMGKLGLYLAYTYAWILTDLPYDMSVIPFIDEMGQRIKPEKVEEHRENIAHIAKRQGSAPRRG